MLSWVATNDAKNCMTKSGMAGRGFSPALVVLVVSGQATTHFFCFLIVKNHTCRQINNPLSGYYLSLLFLPATSSSPSWTLIGLFEPTLRPSKVLLLPHAFPRKYGHGHRQVCRARRGVAKTLSITADANLDWCNLL